MVPEDPLKSPLKLPDPPSLHVERQKQTENFGATHIPAQRDHPIVFIPYRIVPLLVAVEEEISCRAALLLSLFGRTKTPLAN